MKDNENYILGKQSKDEKIPPSLDIVVKDIVIRFIQKFFNKPEIQSELKGEKGERGERGDSIRGPQGPMGPKGEKPIAGKDFPIPKDGRDGNDGSPGKSIIGPKGEKGDSGSPDTSEQIKNKLEKLIGDKRLDASAIKNLPESSENAYQTVYSLSQKASLAFIIDGGGSAITIGIKGDLEIPFNCVLESITLVADQTGSIVVDIWRARFENYPPTIADTITSSAKPTITNNIKVRDTSLIGWGKTFIAGEILRFNVDSASGVTRVLVSLNFVRN